jgi:hypothetical protein
MEKSATPEDIKIKARVNKPPYFRNNKFTIPVEIQYPEDVEISKGTLDYLSKQGNMIRPKEIENNLRRIENITFDCILPILFRSRIAFYPGLREAECPYTTRPVKKIEILDGSNVIASYETMRTDL